MINIDFNSTSFRRRLKSFGKKQPLAKAIGFKNGPPTVFDATAGLGRDAFLLAHLGCSVIACERETVLYEALAKALQETSERDTAKRIQLIHGDSIEVMKKPTDVPEVIYLDPMFPERKKTALVKKEMQQLQQLLNKDDNAEMLLKVALQHAKNRVVLKRPRHAPVLQTPDAQIFSKTHRFDLYFIH